MKRTQLANNFYYTLQELVDGTWHDLEGQFYDYETADDLIDRLPYSQYRIVKTIHEEHVVSYRIPTSRKAI